MRETFTVFEKSSFLLTIVFLTFSGSIDLLWAWGMGLWVTPELAPIFRSQTAFLTGLGVSQIFLSAATLMSSYAVDIGHQTRRHPVFYVSVAVIGVLLLFFLCPVSIFFGMQDLSVEAELNDSLNAEMASLNNETADILTMAHQRFNCCGLYNESTCSRQYPPILLRENDNSTLQPCFEGSDLCSLGCLEPIAANLIAPHQPVAAVLALITAGVSILASILLVSSVFANFPLRAKLQGRRLMSKKANGKTLRSPSLDSIRSGRRGRGSQDDELSLPDNDVGNDFDDDDGDLGAEEARQTNSNVSPLLLTSPSTATSNSNVSTPSGKRVFSVKSVQGSAQN